MRKIQRLLQYIENMPANKINLALALIVFIFPFLITLYIDYCDISGSHFELVGGATLIFFFYVMGLIGLVTATKPEPEEKFIFRNASPETRVTFGRFFMFVNWFLGVIIFFPLSSVNHQIYTPIARSLPLLAGEGPGLGAFLHPLTMQSSWSIKHTLPLPLQGRGLSSTARLGEGESPFPSLPK